MSLIGAAVVSVLLVAAWSLAWWIRFNLSRFGDLIKRIPGPRPLPLIGNAWDIMGDCDLILNTLHDKWPKTYGEVYRFFIGWGPSIHVSSPEALEPIINSMTLIEKGRGYKFLHSWLGLGLLNSPGSKWKSRRRMLTPAFHFHIMEDFFETFNEQSVILCSKIDSLCRTEGPVSINIEELTSLCTLDIICETAMGCKVNAQTQESEYVKAVHSMSPIVMKRSLRPWNQIDIIYHLTPQGREYRRCLKILRDFTNEVIKKRRQEYQSTGEPSDYFGLKKRRPFLDVLLEASCNGELMNDEDIREEVDTFMFEGHDTTAMTLNWFLYCMAANPRCQERVWEELDTVFGDSDRPCTRQDLSELKYLECCIKETLRLYPSVPAFSRTVTESVQIGDFQVPKGNVSIIISAYALHRNPRIYPDPLVFNPDRFSPEQSIGRHPYAFIPFSAGPRNCIGQRFAMSEEKVVLSSLLRRFKFEVSPAAKPPNPSIELTLKSSTGIKLLVSRR